MAKVLGLDPGTKRCGIAISNSSRTMAFPRPALARDDSLLVRLGVLIDDESIETLVIGRPLSLAGRVTVSTTDADALYHEVAQRFTSVSVVQFDERLTTVAAQKALSEAGLKSKDHRDRLDSAAAVVMLQNYVDGLIAN